MRNLLLSAATVLMAGAAFAAPAQSADLPKGAAHNIVLVHGAFVDQTSWKPVADILTKKGYAKLVASAPAHVAAVRALVIDEFSAAELRKLRETLQRLAARIAASD